MHLRACLLVYVVITKVIILGYYFLRNRRMAYLRKRDAKKKQLNGTTTTSVYKTVDPQQNGRKLQRQNTVNMVRIVDLEILTTLK